MPFMNNIFSGIIYPILQIVNLNDQLSSCYSEGKFFNTQPTVFGSDVSA